MIELLKAAFYAIAIVVGLHGLVHLMGFVAYWPLASIAELPYKTTLAGGRWEVGAAGMRVFSVLWLLAALGFLASAAGLLRGEPWWRAAMLVTIVLSTAIISLDWSAAFRGAILNAVIVAYIILSYIAPGILPRQAG